MIGEFNPNKDTRPLLLNIVELDTVDCESAIREKNFKINKIV